MDVINKSNENQSSIECSAKNTEQDSGGHESNMEASNQGLIESSTPAVQSCELQQSLVIESGSNENKGSSDDSAGNNDFVASTITVQENQGVIEEDGTGDSGQTQKELDKASSEGPVTVSQSTGAAEDISIPGDPDDTGNVIGQKDIDPNKPPSSSPDKNGQSKVNEDPPVPHSSPGQGPLGENTSSTRNNSNSNLLPNPFRTANGTDSSPAKDPLEQENVIRLQIKQEPNDPGYEKGWVTMYRNKGPIVLYSDSGTESSEEEEEEEEVQVQRPSSPAVISSTDGENSEVEMENTEGPQQAQPGNDELNGRCGTQGETFPEDLPRIEELTVTVDEKVKLEPLGKISGIVDVLVVVKANPSTPALYDDTVFFSETRQPLGLVFETFGTVEKPFYSMRFNCGEEILARNINIGDKVYFAPGADNLTKYVFLKELQNQKFTDASWEHDNEVPDTHRDFSDDDEEKRVKGKKKNKGRKKANNSEEGPGMQQRAGRGRGSGQNRPDSESQFSGGRPLMQGQLNRNPFAGQFEPNGPPRTPQAGFPPAGSRPPPGMSPASDPAHMHPNNRPPFPHSFGGAPQWQNRAPYPGMPPPHQGDRPGPFSRPLGPHQMFEHGPPCAEFQNRPPFRGPGPRGPNPMNREPGGNFNFRGRPPWMRPPMFNANGPPPQMFSRPPRPP